MRFSIHSKLLIRGAGVKTNVVTGVNYKKWDQLKKKFKSLSDHRVDVGFFAGDNYGSNNGNLPVATVAAWQEFGDARWNVNYPPRPFMRVNFAQQLKSQRFRKTLGDNIKYVFSNRGSGPTVYNNIGKVLTDTLQEVILDFDKPINADSTIKSKGFDDPLIETGLLYDSVKYKIRRGGKRR